MMWRVLGGLLLLAAVPVAASPIDGGLAAHAAGDYHSARVHLRPLADRGSAIAETMLGVMAAKGQGRAADPAVAVGWWLRAANRGYAPAQLALAKALAHGRGVAADPGQAWVWARLAAGAGAAGEAAVLATGLERSFDAPRRARLKAELTAWRPWQAP
jgi:TPR repeat protein